MKRWEMPRVGINQFVANEYVSACTPTPLPSISTSRYAYVDWYPTDDQIHDGYERLRKTNNSHNYYEKQTGTGVGYYNNMKVYRVNPDTGLTKLASNGPWSVDDTYYNSTTEKTVPLFELLGIYDIWVQDSTHVYTYPSSQWDDGSTPTHAAS